MLCLLCLLWLLLLLLMAVSTAVRQVPGNGCYHDLGELRVEVLLRAAAVVHLMVQVLPLQVGVTTCTCKVYMSIT